MCGEQGREIYERQKEGRGGLSMRHRGEKPESQKSENEMEIKKERG